MRLTVFAISAALFFGAFTFAGFADEARGVIVGIDVEAGTVTLATGQTFILTETIDKAALEIGQRVSVTHEPTGEGLNAATKIEPVI
jgi:hypothetical protein